MSLLRFGILLAFLVPASAFAQSLQSLSGGSDSFTISVNPQYPRPFEDAIISLVSGTLDLTAASMTVTVDGESVHSGSVQPVKVPLGGVGDTHTVTVKVTSRGTTTQKSVSIQPQDIALIAEPLSSAPLLYEGKPLIPLNGSVRLIALADLRTASGARVDPTKASYKWSIDGAVRAASSGIGKRTLIVTSPLRYRSATVSVVVTSADGTLVGGDSFSLSAHEPVVRIYEQDPLLGIRFGKALARTHAITNTEATLFAAPFSLPTNTALSFEWFVNGENAHSGNSITLRPTGSGKGSSSLSLVASSGDSRATLNLSLSFETKSNFFGL